MKITRFVCLFLFIAATASGQSDPLPPASQAAAIVHHGDSSDRHIAQQSGRDGSKSTTPPSGSSALSFAPVVLYDSGGLSNVGGALPTTAVVLADVNGDGKPDIIAANYQGTTFSVLLGNGDGTFQPAVTYSGGGFQVGSVAVGDVNGDGKPDVVVTTGYYTNTVGVLLGNGDGTFQAAVTYPSGGYDPGAVAIADLNGDGKADLIVANCSSGNGCGGSEGMVGVLLGKGDGTFQTAVSYSSGGFWASSLAIGDVNGDGKPDILATNGTDTSVGVLLGNGDGTFQPAVAYGSGGFEAYSVALTDVNGDGKPDLVVANLCINDNSECPDGGVSVLLGNGDGTFQTAVSYASGSLYAISLVMADVNGDGKPDIVVANFCNIVSCIGGNGTVDVLLGNGDGTFQTAVIYSSGGPYAIAVAAADINGDGKPDVVVANSQISEANGTVGVFINTGLGSTTTSLVSSTNPSNVGQSVTFTATVSAPQGFYKLIPTGTVHFSDGTTKLGSSSLNSTGVATLSSSTLVLGTHRITASYVGDPNFTSSTSQVLSQVVQGAVVQLSPSSVNFGNMTVGGNGTQQGILVNLTNAGNVALTISSIAITGADSGDFIQNNLCPSSLAAGLNCTIAVQFVPTTAGTRTGALTITDNAANSPQSVSLTGVGVLPAVSLAPSSLSFATQVVFTNSKTQAVTLNNTGLGYLFITNVAVSGPFTQTNNCGATVNPGSSCTFTVTFKPTTAGAVTGALSISDNAPLSPQTVGLKGTGTYVSFNPVSFNFGNQPVGTKSLPKKITLSNKGSVAVSITKISLTGADAADFAETNTCGTRVAAGASCFITVTFTPSAKGLRSASVTVTDNGGGSPQKVGVAGTGT